MSFGDQTINEFLDSLAARTPTPGGGAVAALAGALGCALGRMVAEYSKPKQADAPNAAIVGELLGQLARADEMLRRLADEDAAAYEQLSATMKRMKVGEATTEEHQAVVRIAIQIPMQVAAVCVSGQKALVELGEVAPNAHMISDLAVALHMVMAAVDASQYMVSANVGALDDAYEQNKVMEQFGAIWKHSRELRKQFKLV